MEVQRALIFMLDELQRCVPRFISKPYDKVFESVKIAAPLHVEVMEAASDSCWTR
jgi:hypothetical protein